MKNCIYQILSVKTNRLYIGSAKNVIARKSLHFRTLVKGRHHNIKLQRHFNKYGIDDLQFSILEFGINIENLIDREQYYLDTVKPFFNICLVAGSAQGRVHSAETRKMISATLKGKPYSEERKKNMSNGRKGVKPKPFTDVHKANMSRSMKGIKKGPMSQAQKDKLSNNWKIKRELK